MSSTLEIMKEVQALRQVDRPARRPARRPLTQYQGKPVQYAKDRLRIKYLTPEQEQALDLLHVPPYRVLCLAGHDVGKTFLAAIAVNYWYDCFDPSVVITTAPTLRDVVDLLWTEVRLQRSFAELSADFIGPAAPEMRTAPDHYAKGYTAGKGESFQGRHRERMLFIFDECVGVPSIYFETLRTMFDAELGHAALLIGNPTDTTSAVYRLDEDARAHGTWHRLRLSALDHPNITKQLAGEPKEVPAAISLATVDEWVADWCDPVDAADRQEEDIEWPPGSGRWYRPGPIFQCRGLGLWPSAGTFGVWSEALWRMVTRDTMPKIPPAICPEIGCDVACFGDDDTVLVARVGSVCVHYERHNGWDEVRTMARLKGLARELAKRYDWLPQRIPMKIDDDAWGCAVCNMLNAPDGSAGWRPVPVNAGSTCQRPADYPNKRSELWFMAREQAKKGLMHLGLLPKAALERLQAELMAPHWKPDLIGRRVVEPKAETKKTLKRSPDSADALNLCFYNVTSSVISSHEIPEPPPHERRRGHGFGR